MTGRNGDGFDVFFEQPRFLLDDIGASEFIVYNPRGEHLMVSHTARILDLDPRRIRANQGWFSVRETGVPGWKSFLFD